MITCHERRISLYRTGLSKSTVEDPLLQQASCRVTDVLWDASKLEIIDLQL